MADHQNPSLILGARNNLSRPLAFSSTPGLPTAPGIALAASSGAHIAPAAASVDSALPLRRSVRTALSGGAQRIYSLVGTRTPSTLRSRSASQGSLIPAAANPTFSPSGSPDSPQFRTPTEADLSLSPWPRARSEAGNFDAHSPVGSMNFFPPDRQVPPLAPPPCPVNQLFAAYAIRPAVNNCLDFTSSDDDDDLPRDIHAHAALEMNSRNGQPLLSGTSEDYTRSWCRRELYHPCTEP